MKRFELIVDDSDMDYTGIDLISLVEFPAIEVDFVAFSEQVRKLTPAQKMEAIKLKNQERMKFAADEEEMVLYGPVMIPDLEILRYSDDDPDGFKTVFASKETIKTLMKKWIRNNNHVRTNKNHIFPLAGNYFFETYQIPEGGAEHEYLNRVKGMNLPDGTWVAKCQVTNREWWDENIKSGLIRGFSIEGWLGEQEAGESQIEMAKNPTSHQSNLNMKKGKLSLFSGLKKTKMGRVDLEDGTAVEVDDASMVPYIINEDGEVTEEVAPDGEHPIAGGGTLVVEDGVVVSGYTMPVDDDEEVSPEEMDDQKQTVEEIAQAVEALLKNKESHEMAAVLKEKLGKSGIAFRSAKVEKEEMAMVKFDDGSYAYISADSGETMKFDEGEGYAWYSLPAGQYTLDDGRQMTVVSKVVDGWWEITVVDMERSDLTLQDLLPWTREEVQAVEEEMAKMGKLRKSRDQFQTMAAQSLERLKASDAKIVALEKELEEMKASVPAPEVKPEATAKKETHEKNGGGTLAKVNLNNLRNLIRKK